MSGITPERSFTVFVNNIPPKVGWRWLRTVFQHFGKVVDAFIPSHRSRQGRKFGFVRFSNLYDARKAARNLNGVWFFDYKIRVNMARFNPRTSFWRKKEAKEKNDDNVAESLKNGDEDSEKEFHFDSGDVSGATVKGNIQKYCFGNINAARLAKLQLSVVGVCKKSIGVDTVVEKFTNPGIKGVFAQRIYGTKVLFLFNDRAFSDQMKLDGWNDLGDYFESLDEWFENFVPSRRSAWVACYGVPLQAWTLDTFVNIANCFGEFIRLDDYTRQSKTLHRMIMEVSTDSLSKIEESILIRPK
ncbi:hypothetical protein CCACVL1_30086 [Corchorus capsularis]|uniref:RRM domain-containing protein n=1 Tax=Corchorus capsularis TaxID=210143 RepID=A0A1R3FYS5_COCAP|nr:hypothetical protein CCACVL1_30086 [Corchorus capsularis]